MSGGLVFDTLHLSVIKGEDLSVADTCIVSERGKNETLRLDLSKKVGEHLSAYCTISTKSRTAILHFTLVGGKSGLVADNQNNDLHLVAEAEISISQFTDGAQHEQWVEFDVKHKNLATPRILLRIHVSQSLEDLALEGYHFGKKLGSGSFSEVYLAWKNSDPFQTPIAVKIITKAHMSDEDLALVNREIEVLKKLSHPNIAKLHESFEGDELIFMCTEYVEGGELYDAIIAKGYFTEEDSARLIKQLLATIQYLNSLGIAHRDLKPENVLLCGKERNHMKIVDFGFSKDISSRRTRLKTCVGTPAYVAPEVLAGGEYGLECDIWSIGVIAYTLLCGFAPFAQETISDQLDAIVGGSYSFPSPYWDQVSSEAKDFIRKILVVDPQRRMKVDQCIAHPWIQQFSIPHPTRKPSQLDLGKLKEFLQSNNTEVPVSLDRQLLLNKKIFEKRYSIA